MARARVRSFKIPDCFLSFGKLLLEKAASVILGKHPIESPETSIQRTHIEQVYDQQIARLGSLHTNGTREIVKNIHY